MKHQQREPSDDPRLEYLDRLEARRASLARQERLHVAIGNWRLAVFLLAVAIAWLAFGRELFSPWWLLAPAAVFVVLAVVHERVLKERQLYERAVLFYEVGLKRLDGHWADAAQTGDCFLDKAHPYAEDLDLFGKGSLFQLLCTARTRAGEQTLAAWLQKPATVEEVRSRQAAIDELRPMLDLREDLAVLGESMSAGVNPEALASWGEAPPTLDSRAARVGAAVLAAMAFLSAAAWVAFDVRAVFVLVVAIEATFGLRLRGRVERTVQGVEHPAHDLVLLSDVLIRIERERFRTPRLVDLRSALDVEGWAPSRRIARLNRLIELLDSRENLLMRFIGPFLLWTTQLAFAIEAWRKRSGPGVRRWLEALGEIEALSALAAYAYEHPGDPFPEFADRSPYLEGEGMGHPLLQESRLVRNDIRLDEDVRVLIVSGSNMSGKSTLLRTVGTNAVLALAGAPVRARRLKLSPLSLGASIHVLDSLQEGKSRFFAEIIRLRLLLDMTKEPVPLLFLLDELLGGTNSHDRAVGAGAIVRGLVSRGAIGLVTTHDLALAQISSEANTRAANVHFEDHLEDGNMTFDYLLRPGVVRKSNALELMRSIGLEV